ncbi:hypothetical protein DRW41_04370 [Neobacillus piezotolerans]|uniref:Uncharacterized protein n=1 Tax=Neobacillus piezotolerans TaxID=2259171 RepID=A0A3D8GWH1_9BACI|nr:hypothetical protein [Neobacillus piezotolerans]RDU38800.1 hypothetical protein DRW41_04370 [Neobacillus piezotolerans]
MKLRITLAILLCCLISLPQLSIHGGSAFAKAETFEKDCTACEHEKHGKHEKGEARHQKAGMFRITDEEYIAWAEKFTPDKVAEWKEVLGKREQLNKRWLSPEMKAKREALQQKKENRRKEIMELRKQYESGKLTKEEYMKQAYEKMRSGMNYRMKAHALAINLKIAVEENNSRQASLFLNEMLAFLKEHNNRIKKKMES